MTTEIMDLVMEEEINIKVHNREINMRDHIINMLKKVRSIRMIHILHVKSSIARKIRNQIQAINTNDKIITGDINHHDIIRSKRFMYLNQSQKSKEDNNEDHQSSCDENETHKPKS